MEYNSGAEFNWSYMGGGQGGQGGQSGQGSPSGPQGMSPYPQMGQMSSGGFGGGQQWLHSNQNAQSYQQQSVPQNSSPPSPYEAYNQSMMRYANQPKSGGMAQMGMNPMGGNYGGGNYAAGMNRNGLGNPGSGMGQGANSGYTSW